MCNLTKNIFGIDFSIVYIYNKNVSAYIMRNGSPDDGKKGEKNKRERNEKHESYEKMVICSLMYLYGAGAGGMRFIRRRHCIRAQENRKDLPRAVGDTPGAPWAACVQGICRG